MGNTPFVILTMARSGSTYLATLLRQHPDITCFGEPLNPEDGGWCVTDDELVWAFTNASTPIVGYKILAEQLDQRPHTLARLCAVSGIRFIILQRRDQLERIRSMAQAQTVGVWSRWWTQQTQPGPRVHLDLQFCRDELVRATKFYSQCARLPARKEWLYYEDLCQSTDDALRPVWAMLNVRLWRQLQPTTLRLERRPLSECVENWSELKQELRY